MQEPDRMTLLSVYIDEAILVKGFTLEQTLHSLRDRYSDNEIYAMWYIAQGRRTD